MRKIALILAFIIVPFLAFAADPPEGYEWASDKGALRLNANDKDIYIFDTYESLTIDSERAVGWAGKKTIEKSVILTPLGKDLALRALKPDDVYQVIVAYRMIMIRKHPLSTWAKFMPEIKKALE